MSQGTTAVGRNTYGEIHVLDGQLQVFQPHKHRILGVIQVAEVSHDNFRTFLQIHKGDLCLSHKQDSLPHLLTREDDPNTSSPRKQPEAQKNSGAGQKPFLERTKWIFLEKNNT